VIERNADYTKDYIKRIITSFKNTPVWKETINEIFQEKLDVQGTEKILNKISDGKIAYFLKKGLSHFGEIGLTKRYEIVTPEKPEKEIIEIFKKRIFDTKIKLICCNCGVWSMTYRVKDVPDNIVCPKCGAKLIGVIKPFEEEHEKILKKYLKRQKLTHDEEEIVENILNSGSLVITYGKNAVITLAGRGIGVKTAAKILSPMLKNDELIKEIMKAEKRYMQTKKFWRE
jgi:ATP-dependent Lhr-like helicase